MIYYGCKNMVTTTKGMFIVVVLIAMAGSASAMESVAGQVNSTAAEGQIATLYLDDWPDDYATAPVFNNASGGIDYFYFDDITPMLTRHGVETGVSYNATIEMRCSGVEYNIFGELGNSYTNTLRNTTPTIAHVTAIVDGQGDVALLTMELELCAAEKTFSKDLYEGWNLISLPLTPDTDSASSVLASVWENVTAVYRYNATSKQFESADAMDPGTGYFVHATADCTWVCSGTAYTSTDISLKHGLNMVGWLNCSKDDVGDALSSISDKYHYVARWNVSAEKFEVYNPSAPDPSVFNDFTTMDRGTGYFIAAKQDCALSESC